MILQDKAGHKGLGTMKIKLGGVNTSQPELHHYGPLEMRHLLMNCDEAGDRLLHSSQQVKIHQYHSWLSGYTK